MNLHVSGAVNNGGKLMPKHNITMSCHDTTKVVNGKHPFTCDGRHKKVTDSFKRKVELTLYRFKHRILPTLRYKSRFRYWRRYLHV